MSGGDLEARAEERYEAALERKGLSDLRPLYRELLTRMRDEAPAAYEEAVRRYREEVVPAAAGQEDPLLVWLRYGVWLAEQIAPGRRVSVDRTGKAAELPGRPGEVPAEALVLHLPDDRGTRALALALPASASDAQRETRDLLS